MDYQRVCAIDPGTRNFSYCVVDNNNWREPLRWGKEDLWAPAAGKRGKPTKEQVVGITHAWCDRNHAWLRECDIIMIEGQIRKQFIVMQTVIHALYYVKVRIVHPMTVGSFFRFPPTREEKKAATVRFVVRHATIPATDKQDDYADAWCMAVYCLIKRGAISKLELDFSEQ